MTGIKDKMWCKLTAPPEVDTVHGWCEREQGHEGLCKCPCGVEYRGGTCIVMTHHCDKCGAQLICSQTELRRLGG